MAEADRIHWDTTWADGGPAPHGEVGPPPALENLEHLLPTSGTALELACGRGRGAVWLAQRGLAVWGVDVSTVAVEMAADYAELAGYREQCTFSVADLDDGLPAGPTVDLLLCHLFFDPTLTQQIIERLAPQGVLAIVVLSEVGHGPGRFRAAQGALADAFGSLEPLASSEADGRATLIARRNI